MDLKYSRITAAFIDYIIIVFGEVIAVLIVMRCLSLIYDDFFESDIFDNFNIVVNTYMVIVVISLIIYCAYADYYLNGITIGKKTVGIRLSREGGSSDFKFAIKHSCIKAAVLVIWPITLILYLHSGKMPYDKWLGINITKVHGI